MSESLDPQLLKLCCDGEATPEQLAHLERHLQAHPEQRSEIAGQLQFERKLRDCVGNLIKQTSPHAPQSLRESVRAAMAAQTLEADADRKPLARDGVLARIFTNPQRANFFAVAATLALVAGAVLFGIFGRTIDDFNVPTTSDLVSEAAVFADREHGECAGDFRDLMSKLDETDPNAARGYLANALGTAAPVFDLDKIGYRLVGVGRCDMPVPARSAHLVYRKDVPAGRQAPMLSVFVVRDEGGCGGKLCQGMARGEWFGVGSGDSRCVHKILRGTDGRLVYFLVCCDDRDLSTVTEQIQLASSTPNQPAR